MIRRSKPQGCGFTPVPSTEEPIDRKSALFFLRTARAHGRHDIVRLSPHHYYLRTAGIILHTPQAPPPPPPFHLSKRLTYHYTTGWDHLDKWHEMGTARIIREGKRREEDESMRVLQIVEVKAEGYRPANIIHALRDAMSFGCRCEHDCCGHFFGGPARIRKLRGNRYAVLLTASRNV